jgi:hypothetical protein
MFRILRMAVLTMQMAFRSTQYKIALADSTEDPVVLTVLAGAYGDSWTDDRVKMEVASNPHTPSVVLTKLAHDSTSTVKGIVFSNPSTPMDIRVSLVPHLWHTQKEDMVTMWGDRIPPEILAALADESDGFIRFCVGSNEKTPLATLQKLSEDKEGRKGVARNLVTPLELLELLTDKALQETDRDLAFRLLENPNLQRETRDRFLRFPGSDSGLLKSAIEWSP